jgi:GntR family transcriptional repressor for pyruvate dehydrogenase complex
MGLPFAPLDRPLRLSDQVVQSIRAQIEAGALAPGTRLPSEVVLAHTLGVSRPVLREGLARLRADGFLTSKRGSGIVVADQPGTSSFRIAAEPGDETTANLAELFELRLIVEVSSAELAAERRSAADLLLLERALAAVSTAIAAWTDGADADAAFHAAIARATANAQLARFVSFLGAAFAATRRPSWTPEGHKTGKPAEAQAEHEIIFAAIRDGDARAAGRAAREHLERSAVRTGLRGARLSPGTSKT